MDAVPRPVVSAKPQATKARAMTAVTPKVMRSSPEPRLRLPGGGGVAIAGCSAWSGFAVGLSVSIATGESRLASARLRFCSVGGNCLTTVSKIVAKRNNRGFGHTVDAR